MKIIVIAGALLMMTGSARAEITVCSEIVSLPATLSVPGVYCLKGDLATSQTSGAAITVTANSVTLDMNGWKLGGLAAGPASTAVGISVSDKKNFTLRNGTIRGFKEGVQIADSGASSGHLVEDMLLDANLNAGISIRGSNSQVRRNTITNTASSTNHVYGIEARGQRLLIADNLIANVEAQLSSTVRGIILTYVSNSIVERNVVTNVRSNSGSGAGISLAASSNVILHENKVTQLHPASLEASSVVNSDLIVFADNQFTNQEEPTSVGLNLASNALEVSCVRNLIDGFDTPSAGCAFESGNLTP